MTKCSDGRRPDLFFSYSWRDVDEARALQEALLGQGLNVFVDERSIEEHDSISDRIEEGLLNAKAFLAYYSRDFPRSRYCQLELISAVIHAQAVDQTTQRIFAVNPEDDGGRIEPVELRDARWASPPSDRRRLTGYAARIADAVRRLDGTFGEIHRRPPTHRWWPQAPITRAPFIGQHAALWRLHSGLRSVDHRFAEHLPRSGTAVVHGLGGVGKTALVEQYATDFGPAYPAGVVWLSIHGGEPTLGDDGHPRPTEPRSWPSLLADYRAQVRQFAAAAGIPVDLSGDRLLGAVADHLTERGEHCLWVIDDVPAGLPPGAVVDLLVPSPCARTVLTTRDARHAALGVEVPLDKLSVEDALLLLGSAFPSLRGDADAEPLIADLGGHALALTVAAAELRRGAGLLSTAKYRQRLLSGHTGAKVGAVIEHALRDLNGTARTLLDIADALGPAPLPTDLMARAMAKVSGLTWEAARDQVVEVLDVLEERCIVRRSGAHASVHPVVLRTHVGTGRPSRRQPVASALAEVLDVPTDHARQTPLLVHARHLSASDDLSDEVVVRLLQWLAGNDRRAGEHLSAGQLGEAVVTRAGDPAALDAHAVRAAITAAEQYIRGGANDRAEPLARLGVEAAGGLGGADLAAAHHALARALDGLGRYADADPHWSAAAAGTTSLDVTSAARLRTDLIRAARLRGHLDEAEALLTAFDGTHGPPLRLPSSILIARHLEDAKLQLLRSRASRARAAARSAVDLCAGLGLQRDPAYLEGLSVLVDAELAVHLRRPFSLLLKKERRFLDQARALSDEYAARFGESSPLTLIARIDHGVHLVHWNPPDEGFTLLEDAERSARRILHPLHPHRLRALYGLSIGALRCDPL